MPAGITTAWAIMDRIHNTTNSTTTTIVGAFINPVISVEVSSSILSPSTNAVMVVVVEGMIEVVASSISSEMMFRA